MSQNAKVYQHLLDFAAQDDASEDIRQGLDDLAQGRTRPASDVFNELRAEEGIKSKI